MQGDTALHDAVARNNNDIINMLIACTDVDFKLKNQKGFNVLHAATRRGYVKLVVHSHHRINHIASSVFHLIPALGRMCGTGRF